MRGNVSIAVLRRMPKYYRLLSDMKSRGLTRVSSVTLAGELGFTASQIRQDLNCFGGYGQQGYGYPVDKLHTEIAAILGLDEPKGTVLIGAGNLGRALLGSFNFGRCGFKLLAAFDISKDIIGTTLGGVEVLHIDALEAFSRMYKPSVAVFTMPKGEVDGLLRRLEALNYAGVWNFTGRTILETDTPLFVETVHFTESLMTLSYMISE